MRSIVKAKQNITHGNVGNHHIDKEEEDGYQNTVEPLCDYKKNKSKLFATWVIRDKAGKPLLQDNNDYVYLSSSLLNLYKLDLVHLRKHL